MTIIFKYHSKNNMEAVTTNYTTLKAYLGDQKTQGDLYSHVSSVMSHLVSHAPPNQALN